MLLVGNRKGYLPLYTTFLDNKKLFVYKIRIQFHKSTLGVEHNNYVTKIVNAYIVYDTDN